ncbi:MAG: TlpA family protein disulfide reductase [Chloroflexi bacterium]|nr:TlpA family protein disulfide reductase [Chloroflexota bacterium]
MGGKTVIALGLVTGVVVGGLIVGGLVAFLPGPAPATSPVPTPTAEPTPYPSSAPTPAATASPAAPTPAEPSATTGSEAFGVGEPAPPLAVPKVGGGTIDLAALKGKPVWVNFMATWCPSCVDELPLMAGFAARYEASGLVVVPVDVREDEASVVEFAAKVGMTFPVGLDADGTAQAAWGALALPVHFWIDKDGIVRDGALGGIGPDVMAAGLGSILPGVTVTP